jgi:DNA-binding Lrp family transcriptional regulator
VIRAYVLIQTRVGMGPQVARDVGRLQGVLSSEGVTGPYDVIVRVDASTLDGLGKLVAAQIQAVEGITRTITCIGTARSTSWDEA